MRASAECTWSEGFGFDVTLDTDNDSVGLTVTEARRLAAELLVAAERAESYDKTSDESLPPT